MPGRSGNTVQRRNRTAHGTAIAWPAAFPARESGFRGRSMAGDRERPVVAAIRRATGTLEPPASF